MRFIGIAFLAATATLTCVPAMAQARSSTQTVLQAKTSVWTSRAYLGIWNSEQA